MIKIASTEHAFEFEMVEGHCRKNLQDLLSLPGCTLPAGADSHTVSIRPFRERRLQGGDCINITLLAI